MAFIPLPDGVRIVMEGIQTGDPVVNVFHVTTPSAPTPTDLSNLTGIFQSWAGVNLSPFLSVDWTLPEITATDISVANGRQFIDGGLSITGSLSIAPLSSNVAMVLSWRTPFTGRSFRGRTYLGGLPVTALADAQHFASGFVTDGQNAANALLTLLNAASYTLVVASYRTLGAPRVTGVGTPVTLALVNNVVDTQRKRIKQ